MIAAIIVGLDISARGGVSLPDTSRMFQRAFRIARAIGLVGIICAIPIAVADPSARPDLAGLWYELLIAAGAGLVLALILRSFIPTEQRTKFFLSLSPRLSQRLRQRDSTSQDQTDDGKGRPD